MIKFLSIFMLSLLLIVSCKEEEKAIPEDVIPQEEFVELLIQVQLMESYCQDTYVRPDIYKDLLIDSVDSLLKANGRTIEEYDNSFDYYSQDPALMFKIYEQVLEEINKMQVTNNAVESKPKGKPKKLRK